MRIGYFADGLWAHQALEKIIAEPGFDIVFIVPRYDTQDPVLQNYAEKLGVPYLAHPDVNSNEFIGIVKSYGADIFVSMSFDQILKKPIIDLPSQGFINCHAGALPFYRGRNVLNWALINGEEKLGVTVHYVDEGIDTGDIITQGFTEIREMDNYESLLDKAVTLCAETLLQGMRAIQNSGVRRVAQSSIHPVGFYCGRRQPGDEWINWQWTSKRIIDFIRGISLPGPCARTYLGDKLIAIAGAAQINGAPQYLGTPGEVVGRNPDGVIVKTEDSTIQLTKIADVTPDGRLLDWRTPAFKIGTRLGLGDNIFKYDICRRIAHLESEVQRLSTLVKKKDE